MKICVLASGSKGNMTYIETNNAKVLLDAGISYKNAKEKLIERDIDIDNIDIILISHEHSDHVKHLEMILKKTQAMLYISKKSFMALNVDVRKKLVNYKIKFIEENTKYRFNDLEFLTLQMSHDSADCLGFIFINEGKRISYTTDTGLIQVKYFDLIKLCDVIIIEANHNVQMLEMSGRDPRLIRRILSVKGHMNNLVTASILKSILSMKNKYVILAHISEDCNSNQCIKEEIIDEIEKNYSGEILVAMQNESLKLIEV